jgi:hypothetical protein
MIPLWSDAERQIRVGRWTEAEEIETLFQFFEMVAENEGWRPDGAIRAWQPHSLYFALEEEKTLLGGLQLTLPDDQGKLPCQSLWTEVELGAPARCVHVAILALAAEARGRTFLFWRLVVEMWRSCVGRGITTLYLEVTPRVLPLYRRLGWPLEVVGALREHWGEDCYLCALRVPAVAEALLRKAERSDYYRQIVAQALRITFALPETGSEERETTETLPLAG